MSESIESVLHEDRVFPPPPEFSRQARIKSREQARLKSKEVSADTADQTG